MVPAKKRVRLPGKKRSPQTGNEEEVPAVPPAQRTTQIQRGRKKKQKTNHPPPPPQDEPDPMGSLRLCNIMNVMRVKKPRKKGEEGVSSGVKISQWRNVKPVIRVAFDDLIGELITQFSGPILAKETGCLPPVSLRGGKDDDNDNDNAASFFGVDGDHHEKKSEVVRCL